MLKILLNSLLHRIIISFALACISFIFFFTFWNIDIFNRLYSFRLYELNLSIKKQKEEQQEIIKWNIYIQGYQPFVTQYQDFVQFNKLDNFGNKSDLNYCLDYVKLRKKVKYEHRPKFDYERCVQLDSERFENGYLPTQMDVLLEKIHLKSAEDHKYEKLFFNTTLQIVANNRLSEKEREIIIGRIDALRDIIWGAIKKDLAPKINKNLLSEQDFSSQVFSEIMDKFINFYKAFFKNTPGDPDREVVSNWLFVCFKLSIMPFCLGILFAPYVSNRIKKNRYSLTKRLLMSLIIILSPSLLIFFVNPLIGIFVFLIFVFALTVCLGSGLGLSRNK